jgi:outer membrane protein OmpA-like peptidoglycan-associated protein
LKWNWIFMMFFLYAFGHDLRAQFLHRDKLVAFYTLDGHTRDGSGQEHHGVISGGVVPVADRKGRSGKAMQFNGIDGKITINNTRQLDSLPNQFSFCTWIYVQQWSPTVFWPLAGTNQIAPVLCKSLQEETYQYRWGATPKGFYVDANVTYDVPNVLQKKGIGLNRWTFIATTIDGNYARYYIDGVEVAEVFNPYRYEYNQHKLVIGCDYPGGSRAIEYLNGALDDLRIYRKTLTAKEIFDLYNDNVVEGHGFSGYVYDKKTGSRLAAQVSVKATQIGNLQSASSGTSRYELYLSYDEKNKIRIEAPGYRVLEDSIVVKGNAKGAISKDYFLEPLDELESRQKQERVLFVQSEPELLPESYEQLNQLLKALKDNPDWEIELGGHTDVLGSPELNMTLSEQRIQAIRNYLVKRGIAATRIYGQAYGDTMPLYRSDTEEYRKQNRRVEIKILTP